MGDRLVKLDDSGDIIGKKYDEGKLEYSLIPVQSTREIVKVLMFGKNKYGKENWKLVDNPIERYMNALERHIYATKEALESKQYRKLYDSETGILHMAHAGCCVLFIIWFILNKKSEVKKSYGRNTNI